MMKLNISHPVRSGDIISSLHVGTIEQMGSFVRFWCKNEGNGWKFVMRFSCSGRQSFQAENVLKEQCYVLIK
jgi:hypothetical protein